MEHVSEWLQKADDPPIDPRVFEDIDFREWMLDPELQGNGHDNEVQVTEGVATDAQQQEMTVRTSYSADPVQKVTIMRQASSAHDASISGVPVPVQASPDRDPRDPGLQSLDSFFSDLSQYDQSPQFYGDPNRDLHLARSPSQHHYPDPPTENGHYTNPQDPSSQYLPGPYPSEAQPHHPRITAFGQQFYGAHEHMFVPQQTDFSFSPTKDFVQPLFSADGLYEATASASRTRQATGKGRGPLTTPSGTNRENPICIDCGKRYRTSSSPGRCTRCGAKYERRVAQPFTYTLDQNVPDFATARRQIFSPIEGRHVYQDDVHRYIRDPSAEDRFVQRLLDAINVVQSTEEGWDDWSARQQKTFNEKAKLEPGYTNALMTARLRALYREILNYHLGGDAVYAVGGDNSGYADDRTLRFSQRVATICEVLRGNKRVVMDVVEGRGVQGFVSNPRKYHERKASNNNCNVEKKRIMEKGKEIEAELGSVTTANTRGAKRARTMEAASPMSGIGDFGEGPSNKWVRG